MTESLLLDCRRKIIGTYVNAEENSINESHKEILAIRLDEKLFDMTIHKAIVRAVNKLLDENLMMCSITVQDLLEKHDLLSTITNQNEFIEILCELGSTPNQFFTYIDMILDHKIGTYNGN